MSKWLLRGLVFAALMVIVRLLQGAMINAWETKAGLISIVLVVLFAVAVFIWGLSDGRADARANPDPDRRDDLAMTWLLAGLFAGIVSGAVTWFISLFYKSLYVEALVNEVTTFAAFTALLVFLASVAGVSLGRWLVDRNLEKHPRHRHGLAECRRRRARPGGYRRVRGRSRRRHHANRAGAARGSEPRLAEAGHVSQRQHVALHSEADDHTGRHGTDVRMVPKFLAGVHIADVHLDQRGTQFGARVAQRHRRVGECSSVEHYRFARVGGGVDPAQQLAFAVTLAHNDFEPQIGGFAFDQGDKVVVSGAAVDLRLTTAETAQVGPVDDLTDDNAVMPWPPPRTPPPPTTGPDPPSRPGLPKPSSTTNLSSPARFFLSLYSASS